MNANLKPREVKISKNGTHILIWEKNSHKIWCKYCFSILVLLKKRVLEGSRGLDFNLEGKEGQSKMSWASRGF